MAFANTRTQTSANGVASEAVTDRVWGHDEFLGAHLPEPDVLIEGILVAGTAANWHGPGGVGKTWAALEAARAIAGGWPWLGKFATKQARVLVIDQESHPAKLQDRLAQLNRLRALPTGSGFSLVVTSGLYIDDDPDDPLGGYARIRAYIEQSAPDVVYFDSFTRMHRGDENSAGSMADINLRFRWLMDQYGVAIQLIDHANKLGSLGGASDPASRLRGSSEKLAFVDSALFFERRREDNGLMSITPVKSRWVQEPEPFAAELQMEGGGIRLAFAGERSRDDASRPGEVVSAILAIATNHSPEQATTDVIASYLEVSEPTARRHVRKLVAAGLLGERKRAGTPGMRGRKMNYYEVI